MAAAAGLAKAAGLLMVANLASRILGFVREMLIAGLFGRVDATDAYNTAFILPDLFYWLLVGGVLSAALIPVFSEYIAKENEDEGWRIVSSISNLIFLSLSLIIVLGLILAPQFVKIAAPGFGPEKAELTVFLTRILLIQPLVLALSGLTMGVLNSYKIFWPSALGTVLYNLAIIVIGYLLAPTMGIAGFALGVVVGAAVNFAIQIPALRRVGIRYQPLIDLKNPGVRKIITLSLPIVVSYSLNQVQVAINANLGSMLPEGAITAFWWSYRLFMLPVGIFALAIAVAVFPTMTEKAALLKWDDFRQASSSALRTVLFITIPVSVGMIVLRYPLIRVLFEHGKFTNEDTAATAMPLFFFALGIAAQSAIQVLPRMFYALQDTWTPVLVSVAAVGVNVAAMLLLVKPLAQGGLALATSIAALFNMAVLLFLLQRRLKNIDGARIVVSSLKTIVSSLVMGIGISLWSGLFISWFGEGKLASIFLLVSGTIIGMVLFAGVARLFKMEELNQALALVLRRVRKA